MGRNMKDIKTNEISTLSGEGKNLEEFKFQMKISRALLQYARNICIR